MTFPCTISKCPICAKAGKILSFHNAVQYDLHYQMSLAALAKQAVNAVKPNLSSSQHVKSDSSSSSNRCSSSSSSSTSSSSSEKMTSASSSSTSGEPCSRPASEEVEFATQVNQLLQQTKASLKRKIESDWQKESARLAEKEAQLKKRREAARAAYEKRKKEVDEQDAIQVLEKVWSQ